MKLTIGICICGLLLTGCATPYQSHGYTGGYSETRLAENVFQVTFKANAYSGFERATDFNLLRSAELTLENGFRYFIIVDSKEHTTESTYTAPTTSQTTASAYGYGNAAYGHAQTTTYGGQTYHYSKPSTTNDIVCFKEKPDIVGMVLDAVYVTDSIRKKYGIAAPAPEFEANRSELRK